MKKVLERTEIPSFFFSRVPEVNRKRGIKQARRHASLSSGAPLLTTFPTSHPSGNRSTAALFHRARDNRASDSDRMAEALLGRFIFRICSGAAGEERLPGYLGEK